MKNGHRRMPAYGERECRGKYVLEDYQWSRNHTRAVTIRRWKRDLKKKARAKMRTRLARMEGGMDADAGTNAGDGWD